MCSLFIWQILGFEIGVMVEKVMGDFFVKTADISALAKECMRLYSELAAEKVRLGLFRDLAMKFLSEHD